MKLYRKLIKPVLYYPGQSYEPKKKDLEDPAVWYPEEEHDALLERFKELSVGLDIVGFDEQYAEYVCEPSAPTEFMTLQSPKCCKDCKSSSLTMTGNWYCHMAAIQPENADDVSPARIEDMNKKPDWCPIDKTNAALEEMPPEKREKADMIMKGLSAFFGSDGMLSGEKEI